MSTEQLVSSPLGDAIEDEEVEILEDDSEDLIVEVVDDTPEEDRNRIPPRSTEDHEEELADVSKNVQKRIKKLKYDYHEERRSKEAAARLRDEAVNHAKRLQQENQSLRELVSRGEQVLIDETKTRAQQELEVAKQALRRAHEDGDPESIVAAQEALSKATYASQKAQDLMPSAPRAQEEPASPSQNRPDPRAVEWGQKNPWFRSDREMTAFALAVHENLVSSGVDIQSSEYYDKIDQKMRERFPDKFDGGNDELRHEEPAPVRQQKTQKTPTTVVAPARRSAGASRKQVTLTKTQVALAKKLGVSPESYAKQLLILENKNG